MITIDKQEERVSGVTYEFRGLSTDTKPTGTFNSKKILNGSMFLAMDTMKVYFYDEDSSDWVGGN